MTLKKYLQKQVGNEPKLNNNHPVIIVLPRELYNYRVNYHSVVTTIQAIVSQLPDDFSPDDPLPQENFKTDITEIAHYNLRRLISLWRLQYEEIETTTEVHDGT